MIMGGATDGDFGGGIMRTDYVQKASAEAIAVGRMGTAEDLGAAVPAILSDAFAWANDRIIELNGGRAYSAPTGRPRRDRLVSPRPVVQLALPFTAAGQPCGFTLAQVGGLAFGHGSGSQPHCPR